MSDADIIDAARPDVLYMTLSGGLKETTTSSFD